VAAASLESLTAQAMLDAVQLPGTYAQRLESQRRLLMLLGQEIDLVEHELDRRLKRNKDYRNLLQVKGIGPTLAAVFVLEIGDITRFGSAEQLCCWAGLTPRHYESDTTLHRGHISKDGCTLVRWAAVESVNHPCEPAALAVKERILARRGRAALNIAKVAAARRMLEIVFYVLRDGTARCLRPTTEAA
jgi:transposase